MSDREEYVFKAKLAEQAERYEDMTENMRQVANMETEMSVEERNLLSVAYKNVIGVKRSSWRVISSILNNSKESSKDSHSDQEGCAKEYKKKIEDELRGCCKDVLSTLDIVIQRSTSPESKVFYHKMRGDYCRYLAEISLNDENGKMCAADANEAYDAAYETASVKLAVTHPIRLGLALNTSVFHYEIKNDPAKAIQTAKGAFDEAIKELDTLEEDNYKDSTLIMQLLRDNITLWTQDDKGSGDTEDDDDKQEFDQ